MNNTDTPHLIILLGNEAHAFARQFAAEQATPQKGKRVYLNTLAVYAVYSYLKLFQIEAALSLGDSWHLGTRTLFDVADLVLPSVGKLECRPFLAGEKAIYLPPEVTDNRIGYVAVQLNEDLNQAQLVGFINTINPLLSEEILLADFQPIDSFLECLPSSVVDQESGSNFTQEQVSLSLWFQNTFEPGWQSTEAFFSNEQNSLASSFRSSSQLDTTSIKRAKLINLGVQLASQAVALVVIVTKEVQQEKITIRVQLHPESGDTYLPANIRLILLLKSGEILDEAKSRSLDNFIQLNQFEGLAGECFNIQVASPEASVIENFII